MPGGKLPTKSVSTPPRTNGFGTVLRLGTYGAADAASDADFSVTSVLEGATSVGDVVFSPLIVDGCTIGVAVVNGSRTGCLFVATGDLTSVGAEGHEPV